MLSKINSPFIEHDKSRITLGDILQDFKFLAVQPDDKVKTFVYEYLIVITQDCDLEQWCINKQTSDDEPKNQFLANILLLPAFVAEKMKEGTAYKDLFGITQKPIDGDLWRKIKANKNDRYHFIKGSDNVQDLIVDFKHYLTLPFETINNRYNETYFKTVNELFREDLSRRFANYLSRIGLPEFPVISQ